MSAGALALRNVTRRFGEHTAVDDLSLDVQAGELLALVGASGSGKTTTLRLAAGYEAPDRGSVWLTDPGGVARDITGVPPAKRGFGMVFQHYALFPHMRVEENVAFGLEARGVAKRARLTKAREALAAVGLGDKGGRAVQALSGGEQQRVALARALVNRPKVLLLDEPLGALDLKLRKQMQVELKRIQQEVGITFIYVTHDQEEAMTMSDRIAVMNRGRYEQLADPETLYERPATRFVAGFLGISNLLFAHVDARDGSYGIVRLQDDSRLRIPAASLDGHAAVEVGVRPEKIRLYGDATAVPEAHNRLHGTIVDASYVGVSTQYLVATRGGPRVTVYEQNVERASRSELRTAGEEVVLAWSPDHSFVVPIDQPDTAQPAP